MRKKIESNNVQVNSSMALRIQRDFNTSSIASIIKAAHLGALLIEHDFESHSRVIPSNPTPDKKLLRFFETSPNSNSIRIRLDDRDANRFEWISRQCLPEFPVRASSGFNLSIAEFLIQTEMAMEIILAENKPEHRLRLEDDNEFVFYRGKLPEVKRW
jgi:hypothetical protein